MEQLDVDSIAIARRMTCFYFEDRIFGESVQETFQTHDEVIMAERVARLQAFKQLQLV
jgi:hypothetical protein